MLPRRRIGYRQSVLHVGLPRQDQHQVGRAPARRSREHGTAQNPYEEHPPQNGGIVSEKAGYLNELILPRALPSPSNDAVILSVEAS